MKVEELPNRHPGHRQASASAAAALGMLDYPADKEDVIRKVGDWQIPLDAEQRIPLADILERIPAERFNNVGDAINAVDHHWGDAIERHE